MATSLYGRTSNFYVNGCQSDRSSNQPALRRQNGAVPHTSGARVKIAATRAQVRAWRYVGCKSFVAEACGFPPPRAVPRRLGVGGGSRAIRRGDLGLLMEAPRPRSHDVREGAWWTNRHTNPARE